MLEEVLVVLVLEVDVVEALRGVVLVHPRNLEARLDVVVDADARPAVCADVDARDLLGDRQLERLAVHVVLVWAEGAGEVRDVVGHKDEVPALRVRPAPLRAPPAHHARVVLPHGPVDGLQLALGVQHELHARPRVALALRAHRLGPEAADEAGPLHHCQVPEELYEVVAVRAVEPLRHHALALDAVQHGVGQLGLGVEVELRLEVVARGVVSDEAAVANLHLQPRNLEAAEIGGALHEERLHGLLRRVHVLGAGALHVDEYVVPHSLLLADRELEVAQHVREHRVVVQRLLVPHLPAVVGGAVHALHLLGLVGEHGLGVLARKEAAQGAHGLRLRRGLLLRGEEDVLVVHHGAEEDAAVAGGGALEGLLLGEEDSDAVVRLAQDRAGVVLLRGAPGLAHAQLPQVEGAHAVDLPVHGQYGLHVAAHFHLVPLAVALPDEQEVDGAAPAQEREPDPRQLRGESPVGALAVHELLHGRHHLLLGLGAQARLADEERQHRVRARLEVADELLQHLHAVHEELAQRAHLHLHQAAGRVVDAYGVVDAVRGVVRLDRRHARLRVLRVEQALPREHLLAVVAVLREVDEGVDEGVRAPAAAQAAGDAAPLFLRLVVGAVQGRGGVAARAHRAPAPLDGAHGGQAAARRAGRVPLPAAVVGAVVGRAAPLAHRVELPPLALRVPRRLLLLDDDLLRALRHAAVRGALQHDEPGELVVAPLVLRHAAPVNLVKDAQQQLVLRLELAVRVRVRNHLAHVVLVLVPEAQQRVLQPRLLRKHLLHVVVQLDERAQHAALEGVQALLEPVHELHELRVVRRAVLVEEAGHGLCAHGHVVDVREGPPPRGLLHLAAHDRQAVHEHVQLVRRRRGRAAGDGRELLRKVVHNQLRAPKRLDELRERVAQRAVPREELAHPGGREVELAVLVVLGHADGEAPGLPCGEGAVEHLGLLHRRRVVQLHRADAVARLQCRARHHGVRQLARAGRHERHHHLHRLHLGIRLALRHVPAVRHEEPEQLARARRREFGGVEVLGEEARVAVEVDGHTNLAGLLVHGVRLAVEQDDEAPVGHLHNLGLAHRAVHLDVELVGAAHAHGDLVLAVVVDDLKLVVGQVYRRRLGRDAALQGADHLPLELAVALVGHDDGAAHDDELGGGREHGVALRDEAVQPRRVVLVRQELRLLDELGEVLQVGVDLAPDAHLVQGLHEEGGGAVARGRARKHVAKLRVRKLVDAAVRHAHAEVAHHARHAAEAELVDSSGRGLEAAVGVLRRDPSGNRVVPRRLRVDVVEVNGRQAVRVLPEERAYVRDAVQRDSHGDLKLHRRDVDPRDHLRHGVLHLQARVHLEEGVLARHHVVEVLDRPRRAVRHLLRQPDRAALQLPLHGAGRDAHGALLDDLLVAALHGAVAAVQADGIAVHVRHHLHLEVPGVRGQLLYEYRRAGHLRGNLREAGRHLLVVGHLADALAAAALARLDHARVAHALDAVQGVLHAVQRRLVEHVRRDGRAGHREPRARPRYDVHVTRLREEVRADLVAHRLHALRRGAQEYDAVLAQRRGQLGVLRRVAPAGPHRLGLHAPRHLDDELDVVVVVAVGAAGDAHELVGEADVLRVCCNVLGRRHRYDVEDVVAAEGEEGPAAQAADGLGRAQSVVRDEDLADHARAAAAAHPLLVRRLLHGCCWPARTPVPTGARARRRRAR
mmetsp:Transcript_5933/g.20770  ORF Transcript_5933/g.20770 Transcript_5933/m.20770 type:complete len:1684 (+) Transcript_5933:5712-10763(+)